MTEADKKVEVLRRPHQSSNLRSRLGPACGLISGSDPTPTINQIASEARLAID